MTIYVKSSTGGLSFAPAQFASSLLVLSAVFFSACASGQSPAKSEREKFVPDETQRKSEQMQGRQEIFMGEMGSTSSEQAGVRHDQVVLPRHDPDSEGSSRSSPKK